MQGEIQFAPIPHDAAAKIVADRTVVSQDVFKRLLPELRARAFLISGVEDMNVVQHIRDRIADLPRGASWEDIREDIAKDLGPWMDEESAGKRATLLMRHHGFQAYAAAQHEAMVEQREAMPYWKYLSLGDEKVRASHAALHGLILPASDPFWDTHFPPWDWGCRCRVIPVTEAEYLETVSGGRVAGEMNPDYATKTKGWTLGDAGLKNLHEGGMLDDGSGVPTSVDSPAQRAMKAEGPKAARAAYQWNPGDLRISMDQLKSRYDEATWADFEAAAKQTDIGDGRSLMDWLEGKKENEGASTLKTKSDKKTESFEIRAKREKIERAVYTSKRALGVGVKGVNGSYILKNGQKVVFKPADEAPNREYRRAIKSKTQYKREAAASIIDESLGFGLVPPTTVMEHAGQVGSAQSFVDKAKTAMELKESGSLSEALDRIPKLEREKFVALDQVLYNTDRHDKNYMIRKDGLESHIVAIDNGFSIPTAHYDNLRMPIHEQFTEFSGGKISDEVMTGLQKMKNEEAALRARLDPLLEKNAIDALFLRVQDLITEGKHGTWR